MSEAMNANSVRSIGPVTFKVTDRLGAVTQIVDAMSQRRSRIFAFCNMHTFNLAKRLPSLASALTAATVFNDGVGVDVASLILYGRTFPANLNGTDLTPALLGSLSKPTSVFLIGSPPGIAELAGRVLQERYPLVSIVGTHHGFFSEDETEELVARIESTGTELLLLGMGNPRQEIWAAEIAPKVRAVVLCVGAFFDFTSGRVRRAPKIVRVARIEWLYRLALEPTRLSGRYLGGATPFLYSILTEKIRGLGRSGN